MQTPASSNAPQRHSLTYRPDIDGLRAVAVGIVLLYHADVPHFRGGFMGVDIFFVISGYLISSIILKAHERGTFSFADFYERRARRILPPLFAMMLAASVAACYLLIPSIYEEFGLSLASMGLFVSNMFFWSRGGYFDLPVEDNALLHTWSLAIEEQFYLLYPLLLIMLCRHLPHARRLHALGALAAVSFAACVALTFIDARSAFYLLPTRAWELLLGAVLAAHETYAPASEKAPSRRYREILAFLGFACIVAALIYFNNNKKTPFPGFMALLPTLGACLLIRAGSLGTTCIGRLLSLRGMVAVGLISYSLYLWHWPIIVFAKYALSITTFTLAGSAAVICASVAPAWLSWRWLENPIRKRRIWPEQKQLFTAAALSIACTVLLGLFPYWTDGLPDRMPNAVRFNNIALSRPLRSDECHLKRISQDTLDAMRQDDFFCPVGGTEDKPRFLTWGDSHMNSLLPLFDSIAEKNGLRGIHKTVSSGIPLLNLFMEEKESSPHAAAMYAAFTKAMVEEAGKKGVTDVVLHAMWTYYSKHLHYADDFTEKEGLAMLAAGLEETVTAFEKEGIRVWIIKDTPVYPLSVPVAIQNESRWKRGSAVVGNYTLPLAEHRAATANMNAVFQRLGARHPGVRFLDPADQLCADGVSCNTTSGENILYYDDHHLNTYGALFLEPMLEDFIAEQQRPVAAALPPKE